MNIKYITVVNNFATLHKALLQSIGVNMQNIIILDNTKENIPVSQRYNSAIRELLKDLNSKWLVFCHQDFYIGEDLCLRLNKLDQHCIYGPIGASFNVGVLLGKIIQTDGQPIGMECDGCNAETLDSMCIIVHKDTIKEYNLFFDETFRFHFYADDFCLQAKTKGVQIKILQMNCQHRSKNLYGDIYSPEFSDSRKAALKKWKIFRSTTGPCQ